jgi:hypothetical protein
LLTLHRILGDTKEGFDAQVLFDPFEKQLYLPTGAIQVGGCLGRESEVVGQKIEGRAGKVGVDASDAAR